MPYDAKQMGDALQNMRNPPVRPVDRPNDINDQNRMGMHQGPDGRPMHPIPMPHSDPMMPGQFQAFPNFGFQNQSPMVQPGQQTMPVGQPPMMNQQMPQPGFGFNRPPMQPRQPMPIQSVQNMGTPNAVVHS